MVVPLKQDIDKKKEALASHLKKLDPEGRIKEKPAVASLRSAIRQVWMRAPNKLAVLEQARVPDMNPDTRTKWLFKCAICEGMFKQADVEVDHIEGNNKFTEIADFQSYWDNVLNVPTSGLQVICVDEHRIKTYMEAAGCTWDEAVARKLIIKHLNLGVAEQKKLLAKHGFKGIEVSNAEKREKCFTKLNEEGKLS